MSVSMQALVLTDTGNTPEYYAKMNGVQFSDIPFFKQSDSSQYQKWLAQPVVNSN